MLDEVTLPANIPALIELILLFDELANRVIFVFICSSLCTPSLLSPLAEPKYPPRLILLPDPPVTFIEA